MIRVSLSNTTLRVAFAGGLALLLIAWVGVVPSVTSQDPRLKGGSDGVGGIPFNSANTKTPVHPGETLATLGAIVDQAGDPQVGVAVEVRDDVGTLIATSVTNGKGIFAVQLPGDDGLILNAPAVGVFDCPIKSGPPVVIVVP